MIYKKIELIGWINQYIINEDFSAKHLIALRKIICMFNDSEASEKEIFEFADKIVNFRKESA